MNTTDQSLLQKSSDALYKRALKSFSKQELSKIELAFESACDARGADESKIARTEGANFNPRPARVAQILFDETCNRDANMVASALIATVDRSKITALGDALAQAAQETFLSPEVAVPGRDALAIALALMLDELRHLHMHADRNEIAGPLRARARVLVQYAGTIPEFERLRLKIETALKRSEPR